MLWRCGSLIFAGWILDCFKPFLGLLYCNTSVTVSFSTQVHKWVPENLTLQEQPGDRLVSHPEGVKIQIGQQVEITPLL